MLEVIVTLSVIGLLVALLLPAVQRARETSRRSTCANNLHQVGVALHSHHDVYNYFPANGELFVKLLPFMEQQALADILGGNAPIPPGFNLPGMPWLRCPSDPECRLNGLTNYTYNRGTKLLTLGAMPTPNGFCSHDGKLSSHELTDGLSQTVALSERLVTPGGVSQSADQRRYLGLVATIFESGQELAYVTECQDRRIPNAAGHSGDFQGAVGYSHLLPPNAPGCYNGPSVLGANKNESLFTASSLHSGGVNLLLADGRVKFASDSIDLEVWRALSTRNENDDAHGY
jgi:prepilin-type processing-associated H-X9-DG protein